MGPARAQDHVFNTYSTFIQRYEPPPARSATRAGAGGTRRERLGGESFSVGPYISSDVVPEAIMGVMPRATKVACISLTESSIDTP